MQPRKVDVVVVGGGFTGLAAACAFARAGASVVLLERREEASDAHRGDLLRPKGAALLESWGVSLEGAREVKRLELEYGSALVKRVGLDGRWPALPHPQLEGAISKAAKAAGADLRIGWQLQALLQDAKDGRVRGVVAVSSRDGAELRARLVVGADGRSSVVRQTLGIRWRQVEKVNELVAFESELPSAMAQLGNDTAIFRVGPDGGGITVPCGPARVRTIVTARVGEADRLARLSAGALSDTLKDRAPVPHGALIDPLKVRGYELTNTGHALNYARAGAVCIGDAAHAAPAPSGEGMQMALLDVDALVRNVAPALKGDDRALDRAIDRFERERWQDNERRMVSARRALELLNPIHGTTALLARSPLVTMALRTLLSKD